MQIGKSMIAAKTILLIMGSTRASRICPKITEWIAGIGHAETALTFETIDLSQWRLPMNDEPAIPAIGPYMQPHTKAWSEKITNAAGIVFVTPQYNWGYPAALKNAIDHLYREWHSKPVVIVTYGGHGGSKCAKQLRQIAAAVKMKIVSKAPGITLSNAIIRENAPFEPERDFRRHKKPVKKALIRLARHLKAA
jgi:NAD(P)H-dependent FMN reductase